MSPPPPTRDASVSREELQTLYISTAEPLNEEQQILYNSTVKMLLKEDLGQREICMTPFTT